MFLFSTISTNACHGHGWHCIAYMCLRMGCQTTRPLRQLNCSDNSTVQSRTTWLWDNSTDDQHHQDKSQLNDWPPLLTVIVTCLHVFHVNPNPNLPPPLPGPVRAQCWGPHHVHPLTCLGPNSSCPTVEKTIVELSKPSSCLNRQVVRTIELSQPLSCPSGPVVRSRRVVWTPLNEHGSPIS